MEELIEKLQALVRASHFKEAGKLLQKLGKVERKHAVAIGNLAWRANQPSITVRILNPIVRPKDKIQEPPTDSEKIEYAEGLRRVGAISEAWQLLAEVDEEQNPRATLYKIFCLFNQWRYDESLPLLRRYLDRSDLEPYARAVGQINHAAALIQVGELQEASELLRQIREVTQKSNYTLLFGNSLELTAQVLIAQHNYEAALRVLNEASAMLKDAGTVFNLFVEKWTAIAESLKENQATTQLYEVFEKAKAVKHWETLRDCDLYISILEKNQLRLQHLYCGTPYGSFRRRIRALAGPLIEEPSQYVWSLDPHPKMFFNVSTGKVEGPKKGSLPLGQALHRLMILLTRDLYRPVLAVSVFSQLFPDEHLSSETSMNRVHQLIKRCRQWISEMGLNLKIEESDGTYRLVLGEGLGLILPSDPLPLDAKELEFLLLAKQTGSATFDIRQAMQILSSSASNAQRLLRWALEKGRLQKMGKGSRTCYRVILPS